MTVSTIFTIVNHLFFLANFLVQKLRHHLHYVIGCFIGHLPRRECAHEGGQEWCLTASRHMSNVSCMFTTNMVLMSSMPG
jgi:hypothetical protein